MSKTLFNLFFFYTIIGGWNFYHVSLLNNICKLYEYKYMIWFSYIFNGRAISNNKCSWYSCNFIKIKQRMIILEHVFILKVAYFMISQKVKSNTLPFLLTNYSDLWAITKYSFCFLIKFKFIHNYECLSYFKVWINY